MKFNDFIRGCAEDCVNGHADTEAAAVWERLQSAGSGWSSFPRALVVLESLATGGPRNLSRGEREDAFRWLMGRGPAGEMLIDRTALVKNRQDGLDFDRTKTGAVKDLRCCVTDLGRRVAAHGRKVAP